MAKFVGHFGGGSSRSSMALRGPTRVDAEDELRCALGAIWRAGWKSYYSVRIDRVKEKSRV